MKLAILFVLFLSTLANQYKYTLAQEWPGSVCRTQKCSQQYILNYDGSAWNLHGLWPDKQNGQTCDNTFQCTSEPYDTTRISSANLSKMDKYWVGLYNSVDDFRTHEWTKHGTCWKGQALYKSSQVQDSYFGTVLALRATYSLFDGLRQGGINPSDSTLYSLQSVTQALLNYLKKVSGNPNVNDSMIQIQCQKDSQTSYSMLTQVYVCLDDNYSPMNCNCRTDYTGPNNSCASSIFYPTYRF